MLWRIGCVTMTVLSMCAGCGARPHSPEEIAARRARVEAEYEQALAAALAREGLVLAPLPQGEPVRIEGDGGDAIGRVIEDPVVPTVNGPAAAPGKIVIYATVNEVDSSTARPSFARDAEGKLWLLQIAVQATDYIHVLLPGCRSPWDSGVPPKDYYLGVRLPPGETVAGTKGITVKTRGLETNYAEGMCRGDSAKP
jgi:hypothetical protein